MQIQTQTLRKLKSKITLKTLRQPSQNNYEITSDHDDLIEQSGFVVQTSTIKHSLKSTRKSVKKSADNSVSYQPIVPQFTLSFGQSLKQRNNIVKNKKDRCHTGRVNQVN